MRTGGAIAAMVVALFPLPSPAAAPQSPFFFSPEPRWKLGPHEAPETEEVCAALRRECRGIADVSDINVPFGFDALYDADGNLAGLRMTQSTGCAPIDEHLLLSQRKFILAFHQEGKPDLDDIHVETAPGTERKDVRIVKRDSTHLSLGCAPE